MNTEFIDDVLKSTNRNINTEEKKTVKRGKLIPSSRLKPVERLPATYVKVYQEKI